MAVLSMSMRNIILQYVLQMCVLLLAGCSRCRSGKHKEGKNTMLSFNTDITCSPLIPQPHLSSHELRVETEFSQVENCSCLFYQWCVPYFPMKYYSRQEILPREQGDNWMSINDLQVHICYNTNTGGGNWEQALMTSLMLPQITPWSSTMYGSGKRYKIMSKWE